MVVIKEILAHLVNSAYVFYFRFRVEQKARFEPLAESTDRHLPLSIPLGDQPKN